MSESAPCQHSFLSLIVSPHGVASGFVRASREKRLAAESTGGAKLKGTKQDHELTDFPAPLLLPDDELALDPKHPPQSLRQWLRSGDRNAVTDDRKMIYLVPPPRILKKASFMRGWATPNTSEKLATKVSKPNVSEVASYLEAFYHPLKTNLLPADALNFTSWEDDNKSREERKAPPSFVGLQTSTECIRIRTRASVDKFYPRQLNLDDLLDVGLTILPEDAYALLILVEQDLYEDDDDLFVCGRAYGASRIAVVSMARYHPILDAHSGIDREHSWPASHCGSYISSLCDSPSDPPSSAIILDDENPSPMEAAVLAHRLLPFPSTSSSLMGLWLSRLCRTASHELGHCFGIDHCIYYACVMQGSASTMEDARQPPYLCPVDLVKVLHATGANETERSEALLEFCRRRSTIHTFASLGAWLQKT